VPNTTAETFHLSHFSNISATKAIQKEPNKSKTFSNPELFL